MDDDDEFLYGPSTTTSQPSTSAAPKPISLEATQALASKGVVSHLEDQVEDAADKQDEERQQQQQQQQQEQREQQQDAEDQGEQEDDEEEEEEEEDDSDDDVEIVLEAPSRSLDLRPNRPRAPPGAPTAPRAHQHSTLTTEYTPIARGAPTPSTAAREAQQSGTATPSALPGIGGSASQPPFPTQVPPQAQATTTEASPSTSTQQALPQQQGAEQQQQEDDGVDTSTLPPVKAPPSHPAIDATETGVYDGHSIFDFDMNALADKPWRRPGSDISDWFNYGFDEISWEAYCYRRRDLGDLAHVLKTNIINFSGMDENQLTVLPPEVRTMVMTGGNVAMNNAHNAQNMMGGPGMMNQMMDMNGMVGPMGMDMSGMGPAGMMGPGMMQDGSVVPGAQGGMGMMPGNPSGDQQVPNMMGPDGFPNPNMGVGMGMDGYAMQQDQNAIVQGMYPAMDVQQGVAPVSASASGRGQQSQYRPTRGGVGGGGAVQQPRPSRGSFPVRGRGTRYDAPPPTVRAASPLPPNVPTGPRNANKYKDRDGNAAAVDGLDYGGGKDGGGRRTPSGEPEERDRSSSRYGHDRKRRSSPGLDDLRSSKRR